MCAEAFVAAGKVITRESLEMAIHRKLLEGRAPRRAVCMSDLHYRRGRKNACCICTEKDGLLQKDQGHDSSVRFLALFWFLNPVNMLHSQKMPTGGIA